MESRYHAGFNNLPAAAGKIKYIRVGRWLLGTLGRQRLILLFLDEVIYHLWLIAFSGTGTGR
jgi:hypothetical protein